MKYIYVLSTMVLLVGCASESDETEKIKSSAHYTAPDPLPSWNETRLKRDIIDYVKKICDSTGKDFIPVEDRIATFDNDGTLWAEKPIVQELFIGYRLKQMIEKNPALAKKQPYKAMLEHDKSYFAKEGEKAILDLLTATHSGLTEETFDSEVKTFFETTIYPSPKVTVQEITYQPQLELLRYLRANGFKTYICSGGTVEFMRCISKEYYDIPPEQVIGSSFQYHYVDSSKSIFRKNALASFNDKTAKPANIQLHIGKRPVFACGNEGGAGDIAMLSFSSGNKYRSFQLLVNHNDSLREFYYQEKDSASLKAAAKGNWHVISMKDDWKTIYNTPNQKTTP